MNSTQYAYHPYPSPSQTQAQTPQQQQQQQQQVLSPPQQHQQQVLSPLSQQHSSDVSSQSQQQQQQQQQLSPQHSPSSSHHQSPEQQHSSQINNLDHSHSNNTNQNNSHNHSHHSHNHNTNTNSNTSNNHIEQHSPSHSSDAQSPIETEGELIVTPGAAAQQSQGSGIVSSALHNANGHNQGHTTLLPIPSPALAAATAANTAANTSSSGNRQLIIQQYQQQQQQQQHHHHQGQLHMGMPMTMAQATANGNHPGAINTMMSLQGPSGYMLPSPQSAGSHPLAALPPQSTDLDTILAKYANQPDLLKLIIASKTEEDRRWAEEARYRMMDLIMRGENRGLGFMAGYEALGGVPGQMPNNLMGMNPKRFMEEGGYGHPMFGGFPPSGPMNSGQGGNSSTTSSASSTATSSSSTGQNGAQASAGGLPPLNSPTSIGSSSTGLPSIYAQSPMSSFGMNGMGGSQAMMNQTMGNTAGFNQYVDPSLARKRSVTFAGEVHHMRSQSLSSIPSQNTVGQLSGMSMMGMNGADTFGQQQQQQQQQAIPLQNTQQYPYQQQQMHYNHPFGGSAYPQFTQQLPSLHSTIRRTNSLSYINQSQATVTEPRLAAGRPRNDSSASMRTMDNDSDDDSDEDYDHHSVMGMSSRPGSALSIHNNMGGNGETSLTLEFSDMASVSGHVRSNSQDQSSVSASYNSGSGIGAAKSHRSNSSSRSAVADGSDKRKRKRREMQPVNKVVESVEPYVDPYLWKNNGNTTQKKTGCKSIYYKCSNSPAGCTVNKTVTEKEGGGYVTKYRGEHLEDCIQLKKAQQAAALAAQVAAQAIPLQKEQ